MDSYYSIDFDGLVMKPGEYNSTLDKRIRNHSRISKSLTYDIQNRCNKSFVDIIRDRVFSPDKPDSPNPINPAVKSPSRNNNSNSSSSSSKKNNNNGSSNKKKHDWNDSNDVKISRIGSYFNLDNIDDNPVDNVDMNDEQILHDVSLELKNLNMYCDYSTPTHTKLAPLRVKEKALQKGMSLASILKQQLYYNQSNLTSSMRMTASLNPSPKKRPSTADDSRKRYEARQKLKKKNAKTIATIDYDPIYYKYCDDLHHYDFIISVEHCSECDKHISLRHDEAQYENVAKKSAMILLQILAEFKINARVGFVRVTPPVITPPVINPKDTTYVGNNNNSNNDNNSKSISSSKKAPKRPMSAPSLKTKGHHENSDKINIKTNDVSTNNDMGSRVGALEVQVVFKDANGLLHAKVIHSKLQSMTWPSKNKLADSFRSFVQHHKKTGTISSYANDYLGAYDFLLDDNDSPKKDQAASVVDIVPIKEQVQTCPNFSNCTRGCRATTTDNADNIIASITSALSPVNTIAWCCDTSAHAHNPDYANGEYVAVEIRLPDNKTVGYIIGRVIASHRDGSFSVKYKRMLWGTQPSEGYALLSSSILEVGYMMGSNEDNNDDSGYVVIAFRQHLQDLYIKKGQEDSTFHDELVIRYFNDNEIKSVYHSDKDTASNVDSNTKPIRNNSGFYDIATKVETFTKKYQNIIESYDNNKANSKKKIVTNNSKIAIEEEAYKFSFAQT